MPPSRASTQRRVLGGIAVEDVPTVRGVPSSARAMTSTVDSQSKRSNVAGPTLGPETIQAPADPLTGAVVVASTITVVLIVDGRDPRSQMTKRASARRAPRDSR